MRVQVLIRSSREQRNCGIGSGKEEKSSIKSIASSIGTDIQDLPARAVVRGIWVCDSPDHGPASSIGSCSTLSMCVSLSLGRESKAIATIVFASCVSILLAMQRQRREYSDCSKTKLNRQKNAHEEPGRMLDQQGRTTLRLKCMIWWSIFNTSRIHRPFCGYEFALNGATRSRYGLPFAHEAGMAARLS